MRRRVDETTRRPRDDEAERAAAEVATTGGAIFTMYT